MQTGSPDKLYFLGAYYGDDYSENDLHYKFSEYRLHGEWFESSDDILKFLCEHCITGMNAFYYAKHEIDSGRLSYKDALEIGVKTLNDKYYENIRSTLENLYDLEDDDEVT